ncbi:MAG: DUF4293 domain-containing protein [Candidatus Symbiothrix sp.]|jgi:uncharacterized membrane protein|nr:DUF4293 domain-containing protein [Candidatus Symbiothrix sp.]
MIQRIQTLWLLLCAAMMALTFVFDPVEDLNLNSLLWGKLSWLICFHSTLFSLIALIRFKQRAKQLKWCYIVLGLIVVEYAIMFFGSKTIYHTFSLSLLTITAICPLAAFVFDFMAIRAIKADEALVRSADRLR